MKRQDAWMQDDELDNAQPIIRKVWNLYPSKRSGSRTQAMKTRDPTRQVPSPKFVLCGT